MNNFSSGNHQTSTKQAYITLCLNFRFKWDGLSNPWWQWHLLLKASFMWNCNTSYILSSPHRILSSEVSFYRCPDLVTESKQFINSIFILRKECVVKPKIFLWSPFFLQFLQTTPTPNQVCRWKSAEEFARGWQGHTKGEGAKEHKQVFLSGWQT